ncbi:MAG: HesA/MoeB/ThiF family protein [Oceanococcus sp.]
MSRYSRQEILPQIGAHGQAQLGNAHVGIVGLGGLGSAAASYLGASGVGSLSLMDGDRVELSNLQRQIIHDEQRIGVNKAESAAQQISSLNSEIEILVLPQRGEPEDFQALAKTCDLILDCSDNFPTRHALNAACVSQRCALVSGAAIRWEGQIMTLHPGQAQSPCYACIFAEDGETAESCEQAGVLGPLVGMIGSAQALEAIKLLLGLGETGILQIFDAQQANWRKWSVPVDPDCPVCQKA